MKIFSGELNNAVSRLYFRYSIVANILQIVLLMGYKLRGVPHLSWLSLIPVIDFLMVFLGAVLLVLQKDKNLRGKVMIGFYFCALVSLSFIVIYGLYPIQMDENYLPNAYGL